MPPHRSGKRHRHLSSPAIVPHHYSSTTSSLSGPLDSFVTRVTHAKGNSHGSYDVSHISTPKSSSSFIQPRETLMRPTPADKKTSSLTPATLSPNSSSFIQQNITPPPRETSLKEEGLSSFDIIMSSALNNRLSQPMLPHLLELSNSPAAQMNIATRQATPSTTSSSFMQRIPTISVSRNTSPQPILGDIPTPLEIHKPKASRWVHNRELYQASPTRVKGRKEQRLEEDSQHYTDDEDSKAQLQLETSSYFSTLDSKSSDSSEIPSSARDVSQGSIKALEQVEMAASDYWSSILPRMDETMQDTCSSDLRSQGSPETISSIHSISPQDELHPVREDTPDILDYINATARKICEQMSYGVVGCSEEIHRLDSMKHDMAHQDNHNDLSVTYRPLGEDVIFSHNIGLWAQTIKSNQGISRKVYPPGETLERVFSGVTSAQETRPQVCLHKEITQPVQQRLSYDVDSMLAFPRSLAAFRERLAYSPTLQVERRLQSDIHIERQITYETAGGRMRKRTLPLRDIPHVYIGSLMGLRHCAVYYFFPRLYDETKKFISLTKEQMSRFTNDVMLYSITKFLGNDYIQHVPGSYMMSEGISKASSLESSTGYHGGLHRKNAEYEIPANILSLVNDSINEAISREGGGLADFQDAFLFVSAKGTKLQFKGQSSLHETIKNYKARINAMFNFDYIDESDFYSDIAGEVCSAYTRTDDNVVHQDGEPQVWLPKRCCLESNIQWFYDSPGVMPSGTHNFYPIGFLRDACNMTSVPPKKSSLYLGGLRYSQYYCVEKEMYDALATYPFQNDGLEELSLDPRLWAVAANSAKSSGRRSRNAIVTAYISSKKRVLDSFTTSRTKSYGLRFENRVDGVLLNAIEDHSQARIGPDATVQLHETPAFVWPVTTSSFVDYCIGNANKFCAAFELTSSTSPHEGVRWEQTQLMYMLLKCLRVFFGQSNFHMHSSLWFDKRRGSHGIGFETTLPESGYCWFSPIIDWTRLEFLPEVTDNIYINDQDILGSREAARAARDSGWAIDDAIKLLYVHGGNKCLVQQLLILLAHLCLQRFRQDVLISVAKDAATDIRSEINQDSIMFCHETFSDIFRGNIALVSGNRLGERGTSQIIFELLFGSNKKYNRKHYKDKPYRAAFEKVLVALKSRPSLTDTKQSLGDDWVDIVKFELFKHHWMLPLPDTNGTLVSTAKVTRLRQWWSVRSKTLPPTTLESFYWGRRTFQKGQPPKYPEMLSYSMSELKEKLHME